MIKGLVKSLPQPSLRSLELALGLTKDAPLIQVRDLISAELEFRHVKEAVFAPYMAMFSPRADGLAGVEFAPWIVNNIWASLERHEPEAYQQSRFALRGWRSEDPLPQVFSRLVSAGAELCRAAPEEIAPRQATQNDREEVAEFANYLELHGILTSALGKLPEFMGRIDAEKAATLRLLFKDACEINPESGYRLLEAIFANLDDGAQIIKFVATVSDRPKDGFLAGSELANFGERILDLIEERLMELKNFMSGKGKVCEDLGSCGGRIAQSLSQLQSFEHYIELSREGPWGKRVAAAHKLIADLVEDQLKGAETLLSEALPMKSEKVYGRMKKDMPRLDRFPRPEIIDRARQTVAFVREVRNTAQAGGYASLHSKVTATLEAQMDTYFEELLLIANSNDPFDGDVVMTCFELVTDLMQALCGEEKAQVARRRVAASGVSKPTQNVA